MYAIQKSFTNFISVYFLALIVIGGYFLVNLTLAVIKIKFYDHVNLMPDISNPIHHGHHD
jgi:hypothetical protein